MSDWSVGDLAVCVKNGDPTKLASQLLTVGQVYRVSGVLPTALTTSGKQDLGLTFVSLVPPTPYKGFAASMFRKIRPDEREACEPEFVTLLKLSRKTVRA